MFGNTDTELEALIEKLPSHVSAPLYKNGNNHQLLEVVLDLGRTPEARYPNDSCSLNNNLVTEEDIDFVIKKIGQFGADNRAGIERTLHRISAIRNRNGKIVGLTLRVGRALYGTIKIIEDLILTNKSVLLMGKPGVGKTTMLRDVARVLANDAQKRVIVVDTSNEIAGDGNIPHPGIGRARRMQVASPDKQHSVMIEAVENHMPEVIIIDEIGTELDAGAARTIAERGVQLVATAHGNTLENLILNPTLSDLVGGVQNVTLGDVEARRRRTQKTVLERRAPPTFDIVVEIKDWKQVAIHPEVATVVDQLLRGSTTRSNLRNVSENGEVHSFSHDNSSRIPHKIKNGNKKDLLAPQDPKTQIEVKPIIKPQQITKILPYGVNKGRLHQVLQETKPLVEIVDDITEADLLLTTKNFYRRRTKYLRKAEENHKPLYVLRRNTTLQIKQFLDAISRNNNNNHVESVATALKEAEAAVIMVEQGSSSINLNPQGAYIRRLQHKIAQQHGLPSTSIGSEPHRHLTIQHTQ